MIIRKLAREDVDTLYEINKRCHPHDAFPSFDEFYDPIIIADEKNKIITAGGVQLIAEATSITERDCAPYIRAKALKRLLQHMQFTCGRLQQNYLHAFVVKDNVTHIKALKKVGFESLNSDAFFLEV